MIGVAPELWWIDFVVSKGPEEEVCVAREMPFEEIDSAAVDRHRRCISNAA